MKIGITGTSHKWSYDKFTKLINESYYRVDEIVTGNADGIDKLARKYAVDNSVPLYVIDGTSECYSRVYNGSMNDWKKGKLKDMELVESCDAMIVIWDGETYGTKHVIDIVNNTGKSCDLIMIRQGKK